MRENNKSSTMTIEYYLNELGDELRQLTRHTFTGGVKIGHKWSAKSGKKAKIPNLLVSGHTAQEALAKLLFKLNK